MSNIQERGSLGPPQVWLVRHGSSQMAGSGRWQGWTDVGLSEEGRRQACNCFVSGQLPVVDMVYCSSLKRCSETAAIILPRAQIISDHRLRTRSLGRWEGWTTTQIADDGGEWFSPFAEGRPPGGESLDDFVRRVSEALTDILKEGRPLNVVITHGAVIGVTLLALGESPVIIPPCSFVVVEQSATWLRVVSPPTGDVPPV